MRKFKFLVLSLVGFLALFAGEVYADSSSGLGVSPPYIKNSFLQPGSEFTQKFVISRSNPSEDATVVIELEDDQVSKWIEFDKGESFSMPAGTKRQEVYATVSAPEDVALGEYSTYARVYLKTTKDSGQVEILPGVRMDVEVNVTNEEVTKLDVRLVDIETYYSNEALVLNTKIENLGNVPNSPDRIELDILNLQEEVLESAVVEDIPDIPAFTLDDLRIEVDGVSLEPNDYFADVKVYEGEEELYSDRIAFEVLPARGSTVENNEEGSSNFLTDNMPYLLLGIGGLLVTGGSIFLLYKREKKEKDEE
jgi:hypothetical protein